ncbi:hypothetical protein [Saccharopolyspora sp. CA-218241]|uniref:hypothetical protein n=1 Tax=Saccharopolyspora sp. CA-218241 TaxID=3240027 RepID=UPI003D981738
MSELPAFARALCDDAAVFPPGLAPLAEAVPAHRAHRAAAHADLVGPLVVGAAALPELGGLITDALDLAVTAPGGPAQLPGLFADLAGLPVRLAALEVAVPDGAAPAAFLAELDRACAPVPEVAVFVEVPRDDRRPDLLRALAGTRYRAKFRTGGVTADLHPDEAELAAAVHAAVGAGIPFKATAGLHHALRNTDPRTGFEQHGFLNLLLATDAAADCADPAEIAAVLAERDGEPIARRVAALDADRVAAVRARFLSFGTCSIIEPLTELVDLGLVPAAARGGGGDHP